MSVINNPDLVYYYLRNRDDDFYTPPVWGLDKRDFETVIGPVPVAEIVEAGDTHNMLIRFTEYLLGSDDRMLIRRRNGTPSVGDLILGVSRGCKEEDIFCAFFVTKQDFDQLYTKRGASSMIPWVGNNSSPDSVGFAIMNHTFVNKQLIRESLNYDRTPGSL